MTHSSLTFEICADSVESVRNAAHSGAQRVELCDNLLEGGTTPSIGMIESALRVPGLQVFVIIRPRGGDFYYSDDEFRVMEKDVIRAREAGVHGIVSGVLLPDGEIDLKRTGRLMAHAKGLPFTFHRAFDVCQSPLRALPQLIELGVNRILTSGAEPTALQGKNLIAELVRLAGSHLTIMPGSGIGPDNIVELIKSTGAREYHFSARRPFPSRMTQKKPQIALTAPGLSEGHLYFSNPEIIKFTILAAESYLHGK